MHSFETLFGDSIQMDNEYHSRSQLVLHHGDVLDFLRTLPNETIKLIVTSPPYNIGKEYETRVGIEQYLDEQESVIKELYRVLSPDGSICWQGRELC